MIRIPRKAKVRINGLPYIQVKATVNNINQGDLVLDTKDNCYGYVDQKIGSHVAIKHGCVVELRIPINRIRKLVSTTSNSQNN